MKSSIFFLAVSMTVIFGACQLSTKNAEEQNRADTTAGAGETQAPEQVSPAGPAEGRGTDGMPVLLENTVSRQFDGQSGDEVFRVVLLGDSVLSGTVAFTITNAGGEVIYSDQFPSTMLAATYDESVNTPEKQGKLVRERINGFFGEKGFKTPAIDANMQHDSSFVDKATYDNLKTTDAPGFVYVIGKENAKFIAWSVLEGKVVMYFNCC